MLLRHRWKNWPLRMWKRNEFHHSTTPHFKLRKNRHFVEKTFQKTFSNLQFPLKSGQKNFTRVVKTAKLLSSESSFWKFNSENCQVFGFSFGNFEICNAKFPVVLSRLLSSLLWKNWVLWKRFHFFPPITYVHQKFSNEDWELHCHQCALLNANTRFVVITNNDSEKIWWHCWISSLQYTTK